MIKGACTAASVPILAAGETRSRRMRLVNAQCDFVECIRLQLYHWQRTKGVCAQPFLSHNNKSAMKAGAWVRFEGLAYHCFI